MVLFEKFQFKSPFEYSTCLVQNKFYLVRSTRRLVSIVSLKGMKRLLLQRLQYLFGSIKCRGCFERAGTFTSCSMIFLVTQFCLPGCAYFSTYIYLLVIYVSTVIYCSTYFFYAKIYKYLMYLTSATALICW